MSILLAKINVLKMITTKKVRLIKDFFLIHHTNALLNKQFYIRIGIIDYFLKFGFWNPFDFCNSFLFLRN